MDAHNFDRWTVVFAQRPTRRTSLRLLAGGMLGAWLSRSGVAPARAAQRQDSDGDGLFDDDEVNTYGTKPDVADTDGDGFGDGQEICNQNQAPGCDQDQVHTNPLVNENAAPPPPDPAPPAATCIALGGACFGIDQPCCGNDPATFGYNNIICCPTDLTGGSACTDIAGVFLCPDPAAVPPTGCPEGWTNCGGVCTNLATDHGNCGVCGQRCSQVCGPDCNCVSGSCTRYCSGGLTNCGNICVNLQTDRSHCGVCHSDCLEACNGGTCVRY